MERVLERLETDRDVLSGEMEMLGIDIRGLNGDIAEIEEDLKERNEDMNDMLVAFKLLEKFAKKERDLLPAKGLVGNELLNWSIAIDEMEEKLKHKTALLSEKNELFVDKMKDRDHIQIYLDANERAAVDSVEKEKGKIENLTGLEISTDEDIVAIADALTKESKKTLVNAKIG